MQPPPRVIVVGAGPVGLTAAWALARKGVGVTVLEQASEISTDWRASTFHAATLELLDDLDLAGAMVREGLPVPVYQYRDRRTGLVAEFDMSVLADITRFPYRLQLNQQRLVGMLVERLAASPLAEVRFNHRVTGVEKGVSNATVRINDGTEELTADYVLAADGASSSVRKGIGLAFEGMTYRERFLIVSVGEDLNAEARDGLADVAYISDPDEFVFVLRTPDSWRLVFPVPAEETEGQALSAESLQRRLRSFIDIGRDFTILDRQIYHVHQRVAKRFRSGRVLLLGDAAHVNSPMGGMGLNSGLHDAVDLTSRLLRVLTTGQDPEPELEQFATVRRHVALEYVRSDTERNTRIMQERDPAVRRANQEALRMMAADPKAAREWMRRASLLSAVADQGVGAAPEDRTVHGKVSSAAG